MGRILKYILVVIIILALGFPMLQKRFGFFKEAVLDGSFNSSTDTVLTFKSWFDKSYQSKKESFMNENFGLRNHYVKLNNQVDFSLFFDIHVNDVFRGKNNYLYSHLFYNGFSGSKYKGDKYIDSVVNDLQALNSKLNAQGKKLLVCITPCKESFYTEYLPDTCIAKITSKNYYSNYNSCLNASNIPFLDLNNYFLKLKTSSKYPLFTQGAVHWTSYGAHLALDTLLKRISAEINKQVNLIRIKSVELSDSARNGDDDISRAMNLLQNINSEKLAYPSTEYVYNNDSCYKPKVLLIGDSFYYGLNNTWIPLTVFSKESYFLYYFRKAISYADKPDTDVQNLDLEKELKNTDIVILFFSIGTLDNFPYGATSLKDKVK